ncbi:MAG: hypothetical protein HYY30_10030 [Chloroflexi bacterium]|nr:hypothetical protein [Chloroflexota bacterium]
MERAERMERVAQGELRIADEMERAPYEPLLPIEKKLIAWSLGLGGILMVVLVIISYVFFNG